MSGEKLEDFLPEQLPARWAQLLGPEALDILAELGRKLDAAPATKVLLTPEPQKILRAFSQPPESVRALIVGQDPYPGPSHASGLAFSVEKNIHPLPPSLKNILSEYTADLGFPHPTQGDLSPWAESGVLLLNRHLTTLIGSPGAHRSLGWARFTDLVVTTLNESQQFFVSVLWGREAQELRGLLGNTPVIESAHPSPLSARHGFFGSTPFSRINRYREEAGHTPVDWRLEVED
ncbi:MAG: uracil-DNA glycosylase [Microbacteriaceae bacterium]|nr:uracil-DNA glycosylase [Microbacteriaceae bacterium]